MTYKISKSRSRSKSKVDDTPTKFVRAYGGPMSDSGSGSSSGSYSDSSSGSESGSYSDSSYEAPTRQDNIKPKSKPSRLKQPMNFDSDSDEKPKKYNINTMRKKTMPNESEEDSDDSDRIEAYNLDKGITKTNRHAIAKSNLKNKALVPSLFIKPIYMHKLYVGNTHAAEKDILLNKLGISTIISLSLNKPVSKLENVFIYHYGEFVIEDGNSLNKDGFILMLKIINKSLSVGNSVLIQCDDGKINSIILALLYLSTIDNGLSILQKYDWLKRKIPETELEKDPDTFYKIQSNINRIHTLFTDEIKFMEHCKKVLSKIT